MEVRERDKTKSNRIHDSLEELEGLRDKIAADLQRFWRTNYNFDHRIEDLGVQGYKRVRLFASDIDDGRRQGGVVWRSL